MSENFNTRITLIGRLRDRHDDGAWKEFAEYYKNYIFAVLKRLGVGTSDLEDQSQKVLLALWEKLPEFDYRPEHCKFRTWMNQITRNTVIAYFRKQKRHRNDLERAASIKLNESDEHNEPEIYNMAEKEWKLHVSNLAWENIKDEFKGKAAQVFMMFSEGKDIEFICEELDIKKNTAYVLKNRVQDKLYKEIRRLDDELS